MQVLGLLVKANRMLEDLDWFTVLIVNVNIMIHSLRYRMSLHKPHVQKLLKQQGLGYSMSRHGNCWDNAPQESFSGHMKDHVDNHSYTSLKVLQREIDRYIHNYNNRRYQWGLKKMTLLRTRALKN